jgi:pyrroloquinoline quinone (PQQ) biosynthesis protein C
MGPLVERRLSPQEFLQECYGFKREHAPRSAFMRKLMEGSCTRAELVKWAKDAYYYTEPAVPTIAAWLSQAPIVPNREIYKALARNLAGEMG